MAGELHRTYTGSNTVIAYLFRPSDNTVRDVEAGAWDTWADVDIGDYDVVLTNQGGAVWTADMPSNIATGTRLKIVYRERAGANPATTDLILGSVEKTWDGTTLVTPGTAATSGLISATKRSELLTRVQRNPEIGTDNQTYVEDLLDRFIKYVIAYCRVPRYPELSQGYSRGRAGPTTDLSGLASNEFYVSVDGSSASAAALTLASCTTGANTATECQAVIRAIDDDYFDIVTVEFDGTNDWYQITSGLYGEASAINVTFDEATKHVANEMGLSPYFGGIEIPGMAAKEEIDDCTVILVEAAYRKLGLEGLASGNIPQGMSFTAHSLDPTVARMLNRNRRLWL